MRSSRPRRLSTAPNSGVDRSDARAAEFSVRVFRMGLGLSFGSSLYQLPGFRSPLGQSLQAWLEAFVRRRESARSTASPREHAAFFFPMPARRRSRVLTSISYAGFWRVV